MSCVYCYNYEKGGELDKFHDYREINVGKCALYYKLVIRSGGGGNHKQRIELEAYNGNEMLVVGRYRPKFCPECGEKICNEE